jgi:carbohydrate kinase (thermoresistant glucokinase family)
MQHKVIFIMGVSGSGKTTIGEGLSARTGFKFYDADDFHTPENIAKMKAGTPLNDEDRWPWLDNIHQFVKEKIKTTNIIIVCSALKQVYRDILSDGIEEHCKWVFLSGDYDTILSRLMNRKGHYMPPTLLKSQFDTLEIPANATRIDIHMTPDQIIDNILTAIDEVAD